MSRPKNLFSWTTYAAVFLAILVASSWFRVQEARTQDAAGKAESMPFGGERDLRFAADAWSAIQGYEAWKMGSGVYPGTSPHGKFLRLHYNVVNIQDRPHHVVIKENFGGEGATMASVSESPADYLAAVTVMIQRESGYDPENGDWFWVKYKPDGTVEKNPQGMALAGRVAKGTDKGCIACHGNAKGGDLIFTNDE